MAETLEAQLKSLIVETLELTIQPETIEDTTQLFGGGLGLDSVDALELAAMLSGHFNLEITDRDTARGVFTNVRTMADYIRQHQ
jgi:acyl carrier protein